MARDSSDGATDATTAFNASDGCSLAGLVPFRAGEPPVSQCVRNCEADIERKEEAKSPFPMDSAGSRVSTSPEFLERFVRVDCPTGGDQ
jgi:hypothetical protein